MEFADGGDLQVPPTIFRTKSYKEKINIQAKALIKNLCGRWPMRFYKA